MNNARRVFRLGLVVNPYAGVGGPAAFKGSDDDTITRRAFAGLLPLTAPKRALTFLGALKAEIPSECDLMVVTVDGPMGGEACVEALVPWERANYACAHALTTREDTKGAALAIVSAGVDLLVFVGGDGTARDVCSVIGDTQVALGVPAGVKMHSGVYAINPQMAAVVVVEMMAAELVNVAKQEVRDIDEHAFRQGVVKSQFYGEMLVPQENRFVQQVKQGGFEVEELVLHDIAEHLAHYSAGNTLFIMGPGSTTLNIQKSWGVAGTLLGVDLICEGRLLATDIDAATLIERVAAHVGPVLLVVTAIGGQGHVFGRGNQQITPLLLKRLGRESLRLVATRTKLKSFKQRPLVMDSGDAQLDQAWQGYVPIITGFDDVVFYPLGYFGSA